MSEQDLSFLVEMTLLAAFPPGPVPDGARRMPHVVRWFEGWGRAGDVGVVAWEGSGRLGAAWCRVQEPVLARDGAGRPLPEVAIAVVPDHRGRGVGRLLLDGLAASAADAGHRRLCLEVNIANPAMRLYGRAGFVVKEREGDRVTMVRVVRRCWRRHHIAGRVRNREDVRAWERDLPADWAHWARP